MSSNSLIFTIKYGLNDWKKKINERENKNLQKKPLKEVSFAKKKNEKEKKLKKSFETRAWGHTCVQRARVWHTREKNNFKGVGMRILVENTVPNPIRKLYIKDIYIFMCNIYTNECEW